MKDESKTGGFILHPLSFRDAGLSIDGFSVAGGPDVDKPIPPGSVTARSVGVPFPIKTLSVPPPRAAI